MNLDIFERVQNLKVMYVSVAMVVERFRSIL
jgi:hypothetical protein